MRLIDVTIGEFIQIDSILFLLFRLTLAIVFLLSSYSKLRAPKSFASIILAFNITPHSWSSPIAYILIGLEALIAILFLANSYIQFASLLSIMILLIFMSAVGINLYRGRMDLNCGCFGSKYNSRVSYGLIGRETLLLMLSLYLFIKGDQLLDPAIFHLMASLVVQSLPGIMIIFGLYFMYQHMKKLIVLLKDTIRVED